MAEAPEASPDYASACLRVGDFEVTYLTAGEGPETVVLLHGFGAWSEVIWNRVLPALSDRYRVIAPDLLGFGLSSKPGRDYFDPADPLLPEVRFLDEFLDALGVESAHLVGSSFGGGLAIRYASERPDRVDKLALVGSMGLGRTIHYVYKALAMPYVGEALLKPNKTRIRMMWENLVADPKLVTDLIVDRNFELLSEPGAPEVMSAARYGVSLVGQKILLEEHLDHIRNPTLVVWGKHDRVFPLRHARRAARRLADAQLVILDCGHLPPFETPEAFNPVLRRFLDKRAPPLAAGADEPVEEAA